MADRVDDDDFVDVVEPENIGGVPTMIELQERTADSWHCTQCSHLRSEDLRPAITLLYGGADGASDAVFCTDECAIAFGPAGARGARARKMLYENQGYAYEAVLTAHGLPLGYPGEDTKYKSRYIELLDVLPPARVAEVMRRVRAQRA